MATRRDFLVSASVAVAGLALAPLASASSPLRLLGARPASSPLISRAIPSTGEQLPVIGVGTSGSYDVEFGTEEYEALKEVVRIYFEGGGKVIDTAPNYGNADRVVGALLEEGSWRERCFLATKLVADDRETMERQWAESLRRLRTDRVELLQVHNMRAWEAGLPFARELKEQGVVKYVGFTHASNAQHERMEQLMREQKPDFIQVNYSVMAPNAAESLLPAAQDLGVAVLVNRAFNDGKLFARVADQPLPGWAAEAGVESWAQMFLKFAISHPAVTAVIAATGKPHRQADNLGAGTGPLLDETQRAELARMFA